LISRVLKAFQYRDFRLLWYGACTSSVGTWMQKLAQSWLVLQISGSPFLLGLDSFLGEIPIFLFSLIGGVVADRMDRRRLLLVSQYIQMSCAFLLTALIILDVVKVWHILALSFTVGLAQAFGGPAYQALIPSLVPPQHLSNAIALNSIQFNLARIIGPMIGGLALTKLGAAWCFGLNGLSFVAVIISLLTIQVRFLPSPTKESMLYSMKQGIGFIRKQGGMEPLIALAFLMTALGTPLIVFLPVFAKVVFQHGPSTYTLFLSLTGAGAVLGALLVAGLGNIRRMGRTALLTLLAFGMCVFGFAVSKSLVLSCVIVALGGIAMTMAFSLVTSLVQTITLDEMRGRVMSVYNVAFRGGMPFGSLATGSLVPIFSAPVVLAWNGCLLFALGLYFLVVHRRVASL